MKNLLCILLFSYITVFSYSGEKKNKDLVPYLKAGKWGLCDINKNIVVQPVYDSLGWPFFNCALVSKFGKMALISLKDGKLLTDIVYENISEFFLAFDSPIPHYFEVERNNKKGIIDTLGKIIIPTDYDDVSTFSGYEDKVFIATKNGRQSIISIDGKRISKRDYDKVNFMETHGFLEAELNGKAGYIDCSTLEEITPFKYEPFNSLLSQTEQYTKTELCTNKYLPVKSNGKFGVINKKGVEVIPPEYNEIKVISDNFFIVEMNGKFGCINTSGKVIIPFEYDDFSYWPKYYSQNGSDLLTLKMNYKDYYFDSKLTQIRLSDYDYIDYLYTLNSFIVKKNNKYGIININDKPIIPLEYDKITQDNSIDFFSPQFITRKDGKFGLIDSKGWEIIEPKYEEINIQNEGLIRIKQNGKIGFIDILEHMIISPIYDYSYNYFRHGYIEVEKDKKWGIINLKGEQIIPIEFDKTNITSCGELYFQDLHLPVFEISKGNKIALFSLDGKQLTDFKYDIVIGNSDSTFTVKVNNKSGIVNKEGKEILSPIYDSINIYANPIYGVRLNGKFFYVKEGDIAFYDE